MRGAGGTFLATNHPRLLTTNHRLRQTIQAPQHRFFHHTPLAQVCDRIKMGFLSNHNLLAQRQLQTLQHVVIYQNGYLILGRIADHKFAEVDKTPCAALGEDYNLLKSVTHTSVWLMTVLQAICDKQIPMESLYEALKELRGNLQTLYAYPDESLHEHRAALKKTLSTLDAALWCDTTGQIQDLLKVYLKDMKPIHQQYGKKATQLQLESMEKIIGQWSKTEKLDWASIGVILVVAQGPKELLIEKQYFQRLYKNLGILDPEKSKRLMYAEMLPSQMQSVDPSKLVSEFLAPHLLNKVIGKHMLDDEQAMFKDVLGEHAPAVLDKLEESRCPYHSRL